MVDVGLAIPDKESQVFYWNRWMQLHRAIVPDNIIGSDI